MPSPTSSTVETSCVSTVAERLELLLQFLGDILGIEGFGH